MGAEMGVIALGFDGSQQALGALHWALDEAAYRGADLRVVAVVQGTPPPTLWGVPAPARVSQEELADAHRRAARVVEQALEEDTRLGVGEATYEIVDSTPEDSPTSGKVRVEIIVRAGHPSAVLIDESSRSELVVLGATGIGGFLRTLLGSVSSAVVTHADCPVTIVR
jgi:nucleotide-binding universal stress UspA family protein